MTLQQKCQSLESLLTGLEHARRQQTLADALNERSSDLGEVEDSFVRTMQSIRTLRESGIVPESRLPDSANVTERVVAMRQQLGTAPHDITKGQTFNLLCRAVKKLTERCDDLATTTWADHVKSMGPIIDKRLLDQHRESPRHANAVSQLDRLVQELKPLVKKPPPDAETLQLIEQRWEEMRRYLSSLPVSDDPEVQAFLNAAISAEGASLDLLTPAVKRWLEETNMFTDYCIRRSK